MKFSKYVPLLLTLLVLGCTSGGAVGGGGFSQTEGARITDFTFDVNAVEDFGDRAVLTFAFQNVGGKTMEGNTEAFIFGPPILDKSSTNGKIWRAEQVQGEGAKVDTDKQRVSFKLDAKQFFPPDPSTSQPGMSEVSRVVLIPPNQDEGMVNIPYTFEGQLCYPYRTTTSSIIRSVAGNIFAEVKDAKKTLAETRDSAGPIQISLKAGETIRANSGGTTTKLPLVFEVRDVSGGFATDKTVACDPLVEKSKIGVLTVEVYIDGNKIDCGDGTAFIRNGVGNLFCTGEFQNKNPKKEFHIVAQTKYNYYVSKTATIAVSDSKDEQDIDSA